MSAAFEDAFNLLCGDLIGEGVSRKVFACKLLPDCVVKVEQTAGYFENIAEWLTWNAIEGTHAERWFSRCRWISPNGHVLIMERTHPVRLQQLPKQVPTWFSDLKRTNWGIADDNKASGKWCVCHDYGALSAKVFERGTSSKKLRNAQWIDG